VSAQAGEWHGRNRSRGEQHKAKVVHEIPGRRLDGGATTTNTRWAALWRHSTRRPDLFSI
jgi:hypothetical protein